MQHFFLSKTGQETFCKAVGAKWVLFDIKIRNRYKNGIINDILPSSGCPGNIKPVQLYYQTSISKLINWLWSTPYFFFFLQHIKHVINLFMDVYQFVFFSSSFTITIKSSIFTFMSNQIDFKYFSPRCILRLCKSSYACLWIGHASLAELFKIKLE